MSTGICEKIEEVRSVAEKIAHAEIRVIDSIKIGQAIRQGDIYVRRVKSVPKDYTVESHALQLVAGSTKGSQHFVVKTPSLKLFVDPNQSDALAGPCIVSKERVEIRHPEHAHFNLPAGTYHVTYQRDYAYEERVRVRD